MVPASTRQKVGSPSQFVNVVPSKILSKPVKLSKGIGAPPRPPPPPRPCLPPVAGAPVCVGGGCCCTCPWSTASIASPHTVTATDFVLIFGFIVCLTAWSAGCFRSRPSRLTEKGLGQAPVDRNHVARRPRAQIAREEANRIRAVFGQDRLPRDRPLRIEAGQLGAQRLGGL